LTSREAPTLPQLFLGFATLGLMGFGGVMPLAQRELVDRRAWMTNEEFVDILGLCQFLPGGNIVNLSVAIGMRFRGIAGAIVAFAGLMFAPIFISVALASLYERFQSLPVVRHLFAGLAAAALGLLIAMALRLLLTMRRTVAAYAIVVLGVGTIAIVRLPLLPTMLGLLTISIIVSWKIDR
jgi:chromate transporter